MKKKLDYNGAGVCTRKEFKDYTRQARVDSKTVVQSDKDLFLVYLSQRRLR